MALTCPSCGNDRNFLVKTLQMHIVRLDDARVEVNDEGRPAVIEVLCDDRDGVDVANVIVTAARTGRIGDGKVWVTAVEQVVRIRTGEIDDEAI